jgi:hypothetical protein
VLATQNPVDLDYKGLANAGTWFIGRLQTQRDKDRLLDGLAAASGEANAKFDRQAMDNLISTLGSRVFVLNNVHEDAPELFQTRWTMSYLRGPLTREQIRLANGAANNASETAARPNATPAEPPSAAVSAAIRTGASTASARPVLPPDIEQHFVPVRVAEPPGAALLYSPMLIGAAQIRFSDKPSATDELRDFTFLTPITNAAISVDWSAAVEANLGPGDLESDPQEHAQFAEVPSPAIKAKSYAAWQKDLSTWLYQTQKLDIFQSAATGLCSKPGETERDFRIRLQQASREQRDGGAESLRAKYAPKIAALQERLRRAQQAEERQKTEATQQTLGTIISVGATLVGAFLGRKAFSATTISKASTAIRSAGRVMKESQDVNQAQDTIAAVQQALNDLNAQFQQELDAAAVKLNPNTEQLEKLVIAPKKSNITIKLVALAWVPSWVSKQSQTPAW